MARRTEFPEHPFNPYPIQQEFMEKLYDTLESSSIGLFESPTGTGKTISLICGALHWLEDFRSRASQNITQATGGLDDDEPDWIRTHQTTSAPERKPHPWLKRHGLAASGGRRVVQLQNLGATTAARRIVLAGNSASLNTAAAVSSKAVAAADTSTIAEAGSTGSGAGVDSQPVGTEDEQFLLAQTAEDAAGGGGDGIAADTVLRRARVRRVLADESSSGDEYGGGDGELEDMRAALRALRAPLAPPARTPQIFFASRTHSQLTQFVGELRRTGFSSRLRLVSLAGRKALCVHEPVAALGAAGLINERCMELQDRSKGVSKARRTDGRGGDALQGARGCGGGGCTAATRCADLVAGPGSRSRRVSRATGSGAACPFLAPSLESLETFAGNVLKEPLDVEDLGRTGRQLGLCPYYGSRALLSEADIVALPYSALLSEETRGSLGLQLEDSVVIFDEAHNLVDAVTSSHGSRVSLEQLRTSIRQLSAYFHRFQSRLYPASARNVQLLLRLATSLERFLVLDPQQRHQQQSLSSDEGKSTGGGLVGGGHGGVEVFPKYDFLVHTRLDHLNLFHLVSWVQESRLVMKVAGYDLATREVTVGLYEDKEGGVMPPKHAHVRAPAVASGPGQQRGGDSGGGGFGARRSSLFALVSFLSSLTQPNADGRIVVECVADTGSATDVDTYCLRYTVLNAAAQFASIVQSARSVILASGTLSPVEGLVAQLLPGVPPYRVRHFSCGHVVPQENLLALVAARGPTGLELDLRYSRRTDPRISEELGRLLVNICTAVPAGVVVFAPSFAYLDQLVTVWQQCGVWSSLASRKHIFMEPRSAGEVETVLTAYAAAIQRSDGGRNATYGLAAAAAAYSDVGSGTASDASAARARRPSGAILLSVVGGKLSEGINFGDAMGRCVVVLGLPYPNPSNPELQERMKYLDKAVTAARSVKESIAAATALGSRGSAGCGSCTTTTMSPPYATGSIIAAALDSAHCGPIAADNADASPSTPLVAGLTGRQYYEGLCVKAVNQCVGRVIRHANDYAAIVLVDSRFMPRGGGENGGSSGGGGGGGVVGRLPAWIQHSLRPGSGDFAHLYGNLVGFFRGRATAS